MAARLVVLMAEWTAEQMVLSMDVKRAGLMVSRMVHSMAGQTELQMAGY